VVLAAGICGLLAYWLTRTARGDWKTALPYALVIGGAVGNVVDRLIHGHVVDFIQWHWQDWYWPAFNIADAAIVGGAVGIALFGLLGGHGSKKA
jgi:signal peptidase II